MQIEKQTLPRQNHTLDSAIALAEAYRSKTTLPHVFIPVERTYLNPEFNYVDLPNILKDSNLFPILHHEGLGTLRLIGKLYQLFNRHNTNPETGLYRVNPYSHGRTGMFPHHKLKSNDGREYFHIDAKGIGGVGINSELKVRCTTFEDATSAQVARYADYPGLLTRNPVEVSLFGEQLIKLGFETSRTIAVYKTDHIVSHNGLIKTDMPSYFEVRAFTNRTRIDEIAKIRLDQNRRILIDEAKAIFSSLDRDTEDLNDSDFLEKVAKRIGKHLAILHQTGHTHGFLSTHNISLIGSILDLDTALGKCRNYESDIKDLSGYTIPVLNSCFKGTKYTGTELSDIFIKAYKYYS